MHEIALSIAGVGLAALGGLNVIQRRRLHAARHDPLTGLPTRHLWCGRATRAMRCSLGLVLLVVDCDTLKRVNDTHGHAAGDAVIAAQGRRLQMWVGRHGLVGRFGGDEFMAFARLGRDESVVQRLDELCAGLAGRR